MYLGIASKLNAISLPIILLLFYVFTQYKSRENYLFFIKREKKLFIVILAPLFLILAQRAFFNKHGLLNLADEGTLSINRLDYFFSQIKFLVFYYLKLVIFPFNQNIDPTVNLLNSIFDSKFLIGVIFLVAVLYSLQNFQRVIIFGILWFLISLSPESTFVPLLDTVMEHRLYLPSIGLAIALSALEVNRKTLIFLLILIPIFSVITLNRNSDWISEYSLWLDSTKKSPNKARPHLNLGRSLTLMGKNREAIPHYQKTIELKRDFFEAYHNLGVSFSLIDECKNSFKPLKKALELHPWQVETMLTLAKCHQNLKNYKKAAEYLDRAIKQAPTKDYIARQLGSIYYFYLNKKVEGKLFFQKALNLNPYSDQNKALKRFLENN